MEIRLNPITNEPVLLAPNRAKRPSYTSAKHHSHLLDEEKGHRPISHDRPFSPGNEHLTEAEIWVDTDNPQRQPNTPGWRVRVVPNKYPITDHHEVIIISPDARRDIHQLSRRQVERIVRAFGWRSKVLEQSGPTMVFCNHGVAAGASISHPHAQAIAFPALPPALVAKVEQVKRQLDKKGTCLYCDLIQAEIKQQGRLVWQNSEFVLICPEASGWPYELLLAPKIHQASISQIKDHQVPSLAEALQQAISLYRTTLRHPAYNFWIHGIRGQFFHWHIELIPRTKILAGVELGAGIMVNDRISPEDAAQQFRMALRNKPV
jgi:UDPglucose--hexose-1-phosphate uridylyltransferase